MIFTEILCVTNKEINTYNKKQAATFLVLITILAFSLFYNLLEREGCSRLVFYIFSPIISYFVLENNK